MLLDIASYHLGPVRQVYADPATQFALLPFDGMPGKVVAAAMRFYNARLAHLARRKIAAGQYGARNAHWRLLVGGFLPGRERHPAACERARLWGGRSGEIFGCRPARRVPRHSRLTPRQCVSICWSAALMSSLWDRYQQFLLRNAALGISVDVSRMRFDEAFLGKNGAARAGAHFHRCRQLEAGGIANPDEGRGWSGTTGCARPNFAPTPELREEIEECNADIASFVSDVHASGRFTDVLLIGIGGSALGPQFLSDALGTDDDKLRLHFFDNTDPDGMDRILERLQHRLEHTLVVVISKSGGTAETRNGMLEAQAAL